MNNTTGKKICPFCHREIEINKSFCPCCGKEQYKKKNNTPLIIAIVVVGVLLLGGVGSLLDINSDSSSQSENAVNTTVQTSTTEETISYIEYTAQNLIDDLKDNALSASDKYKNQYIQVTGYIDNIDSSGKYIGIGAGDNDWSLVSILCYLKTDEQRETVKNCKTGDKVVIKGKCYSVGEVLGYSIDIKEIEKVY